MDEESQIRMAQLTKLSLEQTTSIAWREMLLAIAKDKYLRYEAYVKAGFSKSQAIEMIIKESQM